MPQKSFIKLLKKIPKENRESEHQHNFPDRSFRQRMRLRLHRESSFYHYLEYIYPCYTPLMKKSQGMEENPDFGEY